MKKTLLTTLVCAFAFASFAQTTLLSQTYNTTTSTNYTPLNPAGTANTSHVDRISNAQATADAIGAGGTTAITLTGTRLNFAKTSGSTSAMLARITRFDGVVNGTNSDVIQVSSDVTFNSSDATGPKFTFVLGQNFGNAVQVGGYNYNTNGTNSQVGVTVDLIPSFDGTNLTFTTNVPINVPVQSATLNTPSLETSTPFSGTQKLTIVANNDTTSVSITYTAPDGVTSKVLAKKKFDVYIGNTLVHQNIDINPNFDRVENATFGLASLKIVLGGTVAKADVSLSNLIVTRPVYTTLPVSLSSFKGQVSNVGAMLTWATESESNNDRFDILRSVDGNSFTNIGSVKGSGNSSTIKNYSYVDRSPVSGTNYYKLNQIDFDGKSTTYGPVAVKYNISADAALTVYATSSTLSAKMVWDKDTDASLKIFDLSGKQVAEKSVSLKNGINEVFFEGLALNEGIYILQLSDGLSQQKTKFKL